jgi:hypothetical protein
MKKRRCFKWFYSTTADMDDDEEGRKSSAYFERKILRRIYGPKYEDGEWKSRTNRELEELSKGENIVK